MIIFDIFTFKKQITEIFSKENIDSLIIKAKDTIIEQAKANIPGQEKKNQVDILIISLLEKYTCGCKNSLVVWIVNLVKGYIPTATQFIYEFLKAKVESL